MPLNCHAHSGGHFGTGLIFSITITLGGGTGSECTTTRPVGTRGTGFFTTATFCGQQQPVAKNVPMDANSSGRICLFMRQNYHIQITTMVG